MHDEEPKRTKPTRPVPPDVLRPRIEDSPPPLPLAPEGASDEGVLSLEDLHHLPTASDRDAPSTFPPPPLPLVDLDPAAIGSPSPARAPLRRDRILILGRRRAGKTIFLARLYEALWQGARIVDGRMARSAAEASAGGVRISCRATAGDAHVRLMRIAEELRSGKWPAATLGSSVAELVVNHGGREHAVTAIDYPGEVFHKAFMLDSPEPDAVALRDAVDRAAAAILLADPAVIATGGEESHDDAFGLLKAALRIRSGPDGSLVPIAIVFTKCDVNGTFLREAGGTRAFARRHFAQLFKGVERTSVFPCAAVRTVTSPLGKSVPDAARAPENVVEPLAYCIDRIERAETQRSEAEERERRVTARAEAQAASEREARRSAVVWVVFAIAVGMLLAAVAAAAFLFTMRK